MVDTSCQPMPHQPHGNPRRIEFHCPGNIEKQAACRVRVKSRAGFVGAPGRLIAGPIAPEPRPDANNIRRKNFPWYRCLKKKKKPRYSQCQPIPFSLKKAQYMAEVLPCKLNALVTAKLSTRRYLCQPRAGKQKMCQAITRHSV